MALLTWLFNKSGGPWDGGDGDDDLPPKNPWSRRQGNGQKDLDEAFERMQQRFKRAFNTGGGDGLGQMSPMVIIIGTIALIGLWLLTGLFRVQEGELGVVLRFGKEVRIASPGLRYHLPSPIEQVLVQKVAAVNTIDGGMKSEKGNEASDQSLILTGDENMVHTNYTVLWKIKDVSDFLFIARQPEATIKVAAESVIREIIGQTTARSALTE
ncbi:MAG TPA: SPFH domain-containing protein, partial [Candidatus Nitrosotenuis sp.]|nr:SPFH domain-containing protein [Candidatus Nitrosotenuis sp.]